MANKIIHKHSSVITDGKAKIPNSLQLEYGELAVNYAAGVETITLKNTNNEIVEFKTSNYLENLIQDNKNLIDAEKTAREQDIQEVYDIIKDDEEVTASALTNLDVRLQGVENKDMSMYVTDDDIAELEESISNDINGIQSQIDSLDTKYATDTQLSNQVTSLETKISEAQKKATTQVTEGTDAGNNLTITSTKNTDNATVYTISLNDVASANSLTAVSSKLDTLIGNDGSKSVRTIANEELVAQLVPENAADALDTLKEIAAWIQAHPGDASAMNEAIQANTTAITDEETARKAAIAGVQNQIDSVTDAIVENELIISSALTDLDKRIQSVEGFDMNGFATKEYVEAEIDSLDTSFSGLQGQIDAIKGDYLKSSDKAELNNAIAAESTARNEALKKYLTIEESEKNELVIATALTDLDDRIIQLNEDLNGVNADALEDLDTRLTNLTNDFNESDEVSAAAFADLDNRLTNLTNDFNESNESTADALTDLDNRLTNLTNDFNESDESTADALTDLDNRLINLVSEIEDNEYVTALAIADLSEKVDTPMLTVNNYPYTIEPNIYYKLTPKGNALTVTFETPANENIVNQYMFEFTSSSIACTLSLPSSVKWANGTAPSIEANKTYQVSVLNNLGCIVSFG